MHSQSSQTFLNPSLGTTLNDQPTYGTCSNFEKEIINEAWCKDCDVQSMKENSRNWSNGDPNIDHFIRTTQLKVNGNFDYLEWINLELLSLKLTGSGLPRVD